MTVEFTAEETRYLTELLEAAHKELLQELHFTSTVDYKQHLKARVELNERLTSKLMAFAEAA